MPSDQNNNNNNNNNSDDAQQLHQERMQKLNLLMGHLGYSNNNNKNQQQQQVDTSSLLSAKDVEKLRQNMLHLKSDKNNNNNNFFSHLIQTQPDDSYIFAFCRWFYRSLKSSVESGMYQTQQAHQQYQERKRQEQLIAMERRKAEEADAIRKKQAELKAAADERARKLAEQESQRKKDEFPTSAEGRTIKLNLTQQEQDDLHPKVAMIRNEIMDMEKKIHDDLDRVLKTRLRFLTLSREDPPCISEMKGVADCYAQFAAKKYQTATFLEKENATPDVVKRHQKDTASSSTSSSSSKAKNFSSRNHPDLPEELLASEEVLKLSTSVLACRELATRLEKCTMNAGLQHVEKNHGDDQ